MILIFSTSVYTIGGLLIIVNIQKNKNARKLKYK